MKTFKEIFNESLNLDEEFVVQFNNLKTGKKVRKTFKDQKAFSKWMDKNEGDVDDLNFLRESENINEGKSEISDGDLVPGFIFFVLSKDGKTVNRFKVVDEVELNVGPTLNVKQGHVAGDKIKQDKISKEFVTGKKGDLRVFKKRADALKAFKKVS